MIPSPRYTRLDNHKYTKNGFSLLKMAAVYGANSAGKSNLIKAISLLKSLVIKESIPVSFSSKLFRFRATEKENAVMVVEFINNGIPFYYGVELNSNRIITEELYKSGLGKKKDVLIFERKTDSKNKTKLSFFKSFEENKEGKVLISVIEKNLSQPNKTMLKFLAGLKNPQLGDISSAYSWFSSKLNILTPDSKPIALTHLIDVDDDFHKYAEDILCAFNVGVCSMKAEKIPLKEYHNIQNSTDLASIVEKIKSNPKGLLTLRTRRGEEILLGEENGEPFVKKLTIQHKGENDTIRDFDLEEESDGTIRLLDFIPAFKELITHDVVYLIDEIERSIHPLLIKELLKKFSDDKNSLGQIIFTTHESNLLDQKIFRQDEIWFVEKNNEGKSDIYSLSDFKEHNTIDIRKGYLSGRYGSIPFLGNLENLNWHNYDS